MPKIISLFATLVLLWPQSARATPKLVVILVIDQFRADNIPRFTPRFLPAGGKAKHGGFRFLLQRGAYFPFAQFDILQPMTGPGHATILSGSYPYLGGIPANDWFSEEKKARVYCVEDSQFPTVGKFAAKEHLGTSPRNFLGSTVGDELKNAGWPSKVISIALKDRAAILLGGQRADLALWMDQSTFTWVSSQFYLEKKPLPAWVRKLNEGLEARAGERFLWELPAQRESSLAIFNVKREGTYLRALGESFPHTIVRGSLSELASPAGLEMTVDAAEQAVLSYRLGKGPGPDLLALSFSSHDYVGHAFGPNSRENEEMVVAEDKQLARLFSFLERQVPGGMKDVLVALTADHGVAPNAEWLASHRVNAGILDSVVLNAGLEKKLKEKFGSPAAGPWISFSADFGFWINRAAAAEKKLNVAAVAQELKRLLLEEKGFAYAFTAADVADRHLPPGMHERRILKTYVPGRSGDVVAMVKPFFYIQEHTSNHMADYSYDETVPLLLAGPEIRPGKFASKAEVVDLAPTLSFLLDVVPPSLSEGRVLSEAIRSNHD